MTQEQLAETAGIERNQVQNIENNRTSVPGKPANPQLLNIYRLAHALDVTPDALLPSLDGPPRPGYGDRFDAAWPSIEIELIEHVRRR